LAYFYFFYFQVLQLKSKYRVFWARAVELLQMPEYIEQPCSRQHDREVWTIKQCWAYSELDTAAFRVLGKYRMSTSSRSCSRPRYTQHGARLPTARRNVPRDRLSTHRTMVLGKLALEKKFPVAENWLQRLAWRSKLAWSYLSWQPMLWFARSDSSRQFHALYNLPNILIYGSPFCFIIFTSDGPVLWPRLTRNFRSEWVSLIFAVILHIFNVPVFRMKMDQENAQAMFHGDYWFWRYRLFYFFRKEYQTMTNDCICNSLMYHKHIAEAISQWRHRLK